MCILQLVLALSMLMMAVFRGSQELNPYNITTNTVNTKQLRMTTIPEQQQPQQHQLLLDGHIIERPPKCTRDELLQVRKNNLIQKHIQ